MHHLPIAAYLLVRTQEQEHYLGGVGTQTLRRHNGINFDPNYIRNSFVFYFLSTSAVLPL